jgi:carbon starvation protein
MNIKTPGTDAATVATATVAKVNSFGPEFAVTTGRMTQLADDVKEESLYGRTGGAATLAVGMANLFHNAVPALGEKWLGIWYHFALMFEALFILTTLDAGTRVGRYLLQDAFGHIWKPLGEVRSLPANLLASGLVVGGWGYFLIAAVYDPDGGIKALWPIFGIANQLLAATALCFATTVILKMALAGSETGAPRRSPAFALATLIPLVWLLTVTGTAAVQKVWHPSPGIGFLAKAEQIRTQQLPAGDAELRNAYAAAAGRPFDSAEVTALDKSVAATLSLRKQLTNQYIDAFVTAFFLALVVAIFLISAREWILLLARKKLVALRESGPVWLPDYAIAEGKPLRMFSLFTLAFALMKELSGEAAVDRTEQHAAVCNDGSRRIDLLGGGTEKSKRIRQQAYVRASEAKFNGVNRCC